ncbi:hypothetical protein M3Y97_00786200 [Aphelenchoides bicaudatus]|nr:hypothetical protein M3Y97_00786200 [Aphelenchoides bicaudatus]
MYGLPEHTYDWGDFHKFAVIFFSFLGTFVGLGAIFSAIYFGCFRGWLDRFKEEVAETHRMHHPWPAGSARWYFQKWLKTNRSTSGSSKFPPMSASLSRFPQGQLIDVPQPSQTSFPIYEPERMKSPSIAIDRAGYYTPSGYLSPGKLEKIEEYRLIREESTLSRGSSGRPVENSSHLEDRIIRTTTTQQNQKVLRPATYI